MPRKITKYLCNFKCGKYAMNTHKQAIEHEINCYKNPDNKTCQTCNNEVYLKEDEYYIRGCNIEINEIWIAEYEDYLKVASSNVGHINGVINCPAHNKNELTVEQELEQVKFLDELLEKMENAEQKEIGQENLANEMLFD